MPSIKIPLGKIEKHAGVLLVSCFFIYLILSWVLLLRDGRALYAFADFYPSLLPVIKAVEPYTVRYGINSIPTGVFAFVTICAFVFYLRALKTKITLKKVVLYGLLFQIIMIFSYPSLATDIFSYIMSDRVATVYHQNVWLVKPQEFATDPFSRLADWQYQPRVYGEVNQFFYNVVSLLGKNDLLLTVFLYKLLVFFFSCASMYMVYQLAKRFYPGTGSIAILTIFWNPLFVLEIIGSGHNDILMIFFTLAALYFFKAKQWIVSALLIGCAVQVKIIVILLCGFMAFDLLRQKKFSPFFYFSGVFLLFNIWMFYIMQINPLTFLQNISFNVGVYWQSLPLLIHKLYPSERIIFSGGFLLIIILVLFYQWRWKKDPVTIYVSCIFCYLLFFTTAYWNWYVLWILTLIPFIDIPALKKSIIIFSFTSLASYPLFWLALRFNHEHIFWHIFRYLFLCGIPLLSFFYFQRLKSKSVVSLKK